MALLSSVPFGEGDATLWGKSRVISRHTTHETEVSLLLGMRVDKFHSRASTENPHAEGFTGLF